MMVKSGMLTRAGMMARRIRQCLPISQWGIRMLPSTSEKLFTLTPGERTLRFTRPPEIMQPAETMESVATPITRIGPILSLQEFMEAVWKEPLRDNTFMRIFRGQTDD